MNYLIIPRINFHHVDENTYVLVGKSQIQTSYVSSLLYLEINPINLDYPTPQFKLSFKKG